MFKCACLHIEKNVAVSKDAYAHVCVHVCE